MEQVLKDKVVVISGGANGVGRDAAIEFAKNGAKVVIGDINNAEQHIAKIKSLGSDGLYVHTDVRKVSDCKNLFAQAYEKFGKIDCFFNYSGVTPVSALDTCDEETFDAVMDTNFKGCFFCCQEAIKYMRMNGGGSIVLTGSPHAWGGDKDRCAYACSKGVLRVLSSHIAQQYACEHIRCNYLTLGWTPTEGELALRKAQGETEEELRKRASAVIPMGRMCETTDYLSSLVLMMSDSASAMTGSVFRVTAGFYI
ncbi:NAD(P)-binding protein [Anaeromyces robustus]|uniref:NAD(P)-binding protein n=1 Tax=Anaeromyces robustus TaxID=1754192 RepID=A0A1Y1X4I5_9FUNG|nr:NAD(P)-binding protein [Anaeromyces robustus]|eukprot:ORX80730.1 NAD(P)-binding protein [Anaeromyces robustus]